jgi:hypothetical protein
MMKYFREGHRPKSVMLSTTKLKIIVLMVGVMASSLVTAQSKNSVSKGINNLQQQLTHTIQEKIYVHIDRHDHLTGEVLWFKVYCVDAIFHSPMDVSKVAYVEVLDSDNRPVLQSKVPLENGVGSSSFFVPATMPSGKYLFRAYTNWMKNAGSAFYFQQQISIINTVKQGDENRQAPRLPSLKVQFFPEGGHLVENVRGRVAFQVLDESGKGTNFIGAVVNAGNDTIVKFKPLKFGIGSFLFVPKPNQGYRAIVIDSKQRASTHPLPTVLKTGIAVMVRDTLNDKIAVTISSNALISAVRFVAHTRHVIKIDETRQESDSHLVEILVDKEKLGDGISHFTVFDQNNAPVAERLYFKRPSQTLTINARPDQAEYSYRRKVNLSLSTLQSVKANLSVSVFRADSISPTSNIVNTLFLSSDLKGEVESPWYYFSTDADVNHAVDNLMLIHGWRRFNFNMMLDKKPKTIVHLPELRGHLVQGKIIDNKGKPAAGRVGY